MYRRKSHYERQLAKNEHQFCSLECEKEFQHKETFEVRNCEICGKEFECSKLSNQRFCSHECQNKWQTTIVGDLNPRSTKVHMNCDWCGKEFLVSRYKLDAQERFFCCRECSRAWFNNVFIQTDDFKEKATLRAVKIISDGLIPFVYTKPQLRVNSILDECNIKYQNDYNVKYYAVDNYLEDYNLMIEVMGDYWHSNPNIFDFNDLNDIQYNRISRDKAKHTYIKKYYGIEVLYLWEHDIMTNPELCKELVLSYIQNKGVLENYHSFNYTILNNQLCLNDIIILSYADYDLEIST